MSREPRDYDDIPGTYVFDGRRNREGYHLNMFCMTLNTEKGREAFREDPRAYLDTFKMTEEQKQSVLDRDWLRMLQLGGNIYYTFKIAAFDGLSMQAIGAEMDERPITEDDFRKMMVAGGRPIDGNRSKSERD
ncbi:MAG: protocatechuate 4,5-dioxygenase subunit alpha [Pseudomonadota bacterium]